MMTTIHFFENKTLVLTQLVKQIPSIDENIKIKGRKGKVLDVVEIKENVVHVFVMLEKAQKKQLFSTKDTKKSRR